MLNLELSNRTARLTNMNTTVEKHADKAGKKAKQAAKVGRAFKDAIDGRKGFGA